ncbi:hypothetical protein [Microbacterium sp. 22242]|uniref:hypothetical protein n=1 Tax=Microbacterium sp. 22242 TaxID=3453896 RepID=UPI003F875520
MKHPAVIAYTVAGLGVAALVALAAAPLVGAATAAPRAQPTAGTAPAATPDPTPTSDPDRVIWLGDGISVKAGDLPSGCTTYSKIEIFRVDAHGSVPSAEYGRLIGTAQDRGASQGATGTVNRDAAGDIVSYTAAPGDDPWSVGDRLCTNPLMVGRYNHIGTDRGDHALQPGETVVIRPDMNVEWAPGA